MFDFSSSEVYLLPMFFYHKLSYAIIIYQELAGKKVGLVSRSEIHLNI